MIYNYNNNERPFKMKKGFIDVALAIILGASILGLGAYFGLEKAFKPVQPEPQQFGSTGVVQAQAFSLSGSGVTATANSINLTSFKLPDASTTIVMANFSNGIGYGTLEPGTSKEEQVSFTGVTQNADGTASLTGVTRGINFVSPFNSVSAYQKAHAGGTKFVLSNTSAFYAQFLATNSTNTITAVQTFNATSIPVFNSEPSFTTGTQIVDKTYVDSVATSGSPNASFTIKGLVQLASTSQVISGTATSSNTVYLVPPNQFFNATSSANNIIPVTNALGKLSNGFIDMTANYAWSGTHSFAATTTVNGQFNAASTTFSQLPLAPTSTPTSNNQLITLNTLNSRSNTAFSNATKSLTVDNSQYLFFSTSTDLGAMGANDLINLSGGVVTTGNGNWSMNILVNKVVVASSSFTQNANIHFWGQLLANNSTSSIKEIISYVDSGNTVFGVIGANTVTTVDVSTSTIVSVSFYQANSGSLSLTNFDLEKKSANNTF